MKKKSVLSVGNGRQYAMCTIDVNLDKEYVGDFLVAFGIKFSEWDYNHGETTMKFPLSCSAPGRNFLWESEQKCQGILPLHRSELEEMVANFGKRWCLRVTFYEDSLLDFLDLVEKFAIVHKMEFHHSNNFRELQAKLEKELKKSVS